MNERDGRKERMVYRRRASHRVKRPRFCPVCGKELNGTRGLRLHRQRMGH